jgi:hypothetical protein
MQKRCFVDRRVFWKSENAVRVLVLCEMQKRCFVDRRVFWKSENAVRVLVLCEMQKRCFVDRRVVWKSENAVRVRHTIWPNVQMAVLDGSTLLVLLDMSVKVLGLGVILLDVLKSRVALFRRLVMMLFSTVA